ncbi:MAG: hypothetical protein R6W91_01865 [Thermoplasmata archaeon]
MRDRNGMKDGVITATPNMMSPIYLRKDSVYIQYSKRTIILGVVFGIIFIVALFLLIDKYLNFWPPGWQPPRDIGFIYHVF